MMESSRIKNFGTKIQRLIEGKDLSRDETNWMFREVLLNRQPDLQQGAFLAALVAKGETVEEIAGAWTAIDELDTVHVAPDLPDALFENSGTGMDTLKTFNVSSAAAVVAAACGVAMARHGARQLPLAAVLLMFWKLSA
jgi:anthranilate phosphoribosyltransferase